MTLLSIISLGFFLGMRHATDADHVIAVNTIVSRQHTMASAILIGSMWGIGHTLTIVVVGGAIILFSDACRARYVEPHGPHSVDPGRLQVGRDAQNRTPRARAQPWRLLS